MFTQTKTDYYEPTPLTFRQQILLSLCNNVTVFSRDFTYEKMAISMVHLAKRDYSDIVNNQIMELVWEI